jgi:hypothetical protein
VHCRLFRGLDCSSGLLYSLFADCLLRPHRPNESLHCQSIANGRWRESIGKAFPNQCCTNTSSSGSSFDSKGGFTGIAVAFDDGVGDGGVWWEYFQKLLHEVEGLVDGSLGSRMHMMAKQRGDNVQHRCRTLNDGLKEK